MRVLEHCDQDVFRDVIGHFASGVTIVTARHGDVDRGVTANAVSSLSLEPPMLLVCINRASRTHGAVSRCRSFAVNILRDGQEELARLFATRRDDKFADLELERGELGHPLIDGTLAQLECRVAEEAIGGTHSIFLAAVVSARRQEGEPLVYYRGGFGRFDPA
jgi:4-nitrophenol 2-monooxygenase / 4-nitrocatechol 4-monooxygenase, reductase component